MLSSPPPYELREMCAADLTAVYQIDKLSFPTPARKGIFEHEINTNDLAAYQVLCEQERVIGFAGFWLLADEVHISTIAIHPDWRGKNLGELLLLNLLFLAYKRPANIVTLEVRTSNVAAQNLYKKYRFNQVGRRPRYYKDTDEDALIMTAPDLNANYHQFLVSQKERLFSTLTSEVSRP